MWHGLVRVAMSERIGHAHADEGMAHMRRPRDQLGDGAVVSYNHRRLDHPQNVGPL